MTSVTQSVGRESIQRARLAHRGGDRAQRGASPMWPWPFCTSRTVWRSRTSLVPLIGATTLATAAVYATLWLLLRPVVVRFSLVPVSAALALAMMMGAGFALTTLAGAPHRGSDAPYHLSLRRRRGVLGRAGDGDLRRARVPPRPDRGPRPVASARSGPAGRTVRGVGVRVGRGLRGRLGALGGVACARSGAHPGRRPQSRCVFGHAECGNGRADPGVFS